MPTKLRRKKLQRAAEVAEEAVRAGPHTCAVLAAGDRAGMVWSHVVPGKDGAQLDSNFPIASITKPIFATAVMQLAEQGKLHLSLPVSAYLPGFEANGKGDITTWHILTHSSGMEEDRLWEELWSLPELPEESWFNDAFRRAGLNYQPGTAHRYNTFAFSVLTEIITRVSGKPYKEYLRESIFAPLGMESTDFTWVDRQRAMPVHGDVPPGDLERVNALAIPLGLYSTLADLMAFGLAYLNDGRGKGYQLLSPATVAIMARHYTQGKTQTENGKEVGFNYGLGWGKPSWPPNGDILASDSAYGHAGASGSLLWIDPEWDLVYVFLTNHWGIEDPSQTYVRALNAVYGALRRT